MLATQQFETKTTSELTVVQNLLEALHLEKVVFTMDALFLSKKTDELIISGGNDFIVTVKGNQPRLLAQLQTKAEHTRALAFVCRCGEKSGTNKNRES